MPKSRGRKMKPGQREREREAVIRRATRDRERNYWVATQFGAVSDMENEEQCAEVRQVTHDRVIEATKGVRASGVEWHMVEATNLEGCQALLGTAHGMSEQDRENAAGLLAFLEANPGGALVIASCKAQRGQHRHQAHLS